MKPRQTRKKPVVNVKTSKSVVTINSDPHGPAVNPCEESEKFGFNDHCDCFYTGYGEDCCWCEKLGWMDHEGDVND